MLQTMRCKKYLFHLFLLAALVLETYKPAISQGLFAGELPPESINTKTYTNLDGLSSNITGALYQDTIGFLWIGTADGLNRFDGTQFVNYFSSAAVGSNTLPDNWITGIVQYKHYLIIGTMKGLGALNLKTNTFENDVINKTVHHAPKGVPQVFYKVDRYYALVSDFTFTLYDEHLHLIKHFDYSSKTSPQTRFYFGMNNPVMYDENHLAIFNVYGYQLLSIKTFGLGQTDTVKNEPVAGKAYYAHASLFKNRDQLFFHPAYGSNLSFYDTVRQQHGTVFINDKHPYMGERSTVGKILKRGSDNVLCATSSGLLFYNFKSGAKKLYNLAAESRTEQVDGYVNILHDREQNIWIASTNGLIKISQHLNNFSGNEITKILSNDNDIVKIISHKHYNFYLTNNPPAITVANKLNGVKKTFPLPQSAFAIINAIALNDSQIFISTYNNVHIFDHTKSKFSKNNFCPDSLRDVSCHGLLLDAHNNLWMGYGGGQGLFRYNLTTGTSKHFSKYLYDSTDTRYLPIRNACHIMEIDSNHIAMGNNQFGNVLCLWNAMEDKITIVKAANAIDNYQPYHSVITDMKLDKNQTLWLATHNGLVNYKHQSNTYKYYGRQAGLDNTLVSSIEFDNRNNLWIGTCYGIYTLDIATDKIKNYKENSIINRYNIQYMHYDSARQCMYVCGNDDNLQFNPNQMFKNAYKSFTFFDNIVVNGKPISITADTIFNHEQQDFQFNFGSINLGSGALNQYYYKLLPMDTLWHALKHQRQINFVQLSHGDYTLLITSKNNDNIWGSTAQYHFTINKAYYQTWWYYSLIVIGICLIAYLFYAFRIKQLKKVYALRNRLSRDLHDDIGSTLSSIIILSRSVQNNEADNHVERANKTLEKINERSTRLMQNIKDIIWNINPTNDTLEELLFRMREYASSMLEAKKIDYQINFPNDIQKIIFTGETKNNLYLIFKEAVNNLVKYSRATKVHLQLMIDKKTIYLKIEDNGIGFNINELRHRGGLINMQQRADELNAKLNIESVIGHGTIVELVFESYSRIFSSKQNH